jgi:hypothetical protein
MQSIEMGTIEDAGFHQSDQLGHVFRGDVRIQPQYQVAGDRSQD